MGTALQLNIFDMMGGGIPVIPVKQEIVPKPKKAPSKKKTFFEVWEGRTIDDWGCVTSDEFKAFSKGLKAYLKKAAGEKGINLAKYSSGHYDMSGFFEKAGKYVYFSYDVRYRQLNFDDIGCSKGVLYRTAQSDKDFRGGGNRFCSLRELINSVDSLFEKGGW